MNMQPSAEFFAGNRARLRTLFTGTAPIIVTANGQLQRNADSAYAFRQDSSFWYLTGITEPDVILVMDKTKEYLMIPGRDDNRAAFDGVLNQEYLQHVSGIQTVLSADAGWKQLAPRLKRVKHVATLAASPGYSEHYGMYANPARAYLTERIMSINGSIELLDLRQHLTKMRMIKQPLELACIQRAIDITGQALADVAAHGWSRFTSENQVEGYITSSFRAADAQHAYSPIVATGGNACTLHYTNNNSALSEGQLLLLDVGAEVAHYAADITRTYSMATPTKRQQQVFDAVLAVQNYAFEHLRPGMTLRDFEAKVQHYMGEKLRELGLIKSIDADQLRTYYPHATSHFLGLDVHDVGDYAALLEPGMVLTVEPGIYIPEENIGIRIEDNVVLTTDGLSVVSNAIPRVLEYM